jgi:hypothetical protein
MTKVLNVVLLLVLVIFPFFIVQAQGSNDFECSAEGLDALISDINGRLSELQGSEQFDIGQALDDIYETEQLLADFRLQCAGLEFHGNANSVLGPVTFPDGTYRVTVTTSGFFIADIEAVSGSCDTDWNGLFNLTSGRASTGAQSSFTSHGCVGLIEISNISSDWTLVFENLTNPSSSTALNSSAVSNQEETSKPQAGNDVGDVIEPGTTINGVLFANSSTEYRFQGSMGDLVTVGAVKTSGTADLALALYDPNGGLLFEDDDSNPEGFLNPLIQAIPLPIDGDYRIVVKTCDSCDASASAAFALSLEVRASTGSNNDSAVLEYGASREGVLLANQEVEFTFQGTSGDVVTIDAIKTSGTADLALVLYGPNGRVLFEDDDSNPEGFLNPLISGLPLPETGEYRVVVKRCSFCDTATSGGFRISLSAR